MTTILSDQDREKRESDLVLLCYILYICGLVLPGVLPAVVAIVINYIKVDDMVSDIWKSHFRWQISTFWFTILWTLISVPLILFFGLGFLLLFLVIPVWCIYRYTKGLLRWNDLRAMD